MASAQFVRQSAPDRLEIRSSGGCASRLGILFIAAGVFLVMMALQILPISNAQEVPLWGWPLILKSDGDLRTDEAWEG